MLTIIFGAGASYDSIPSRPPGVVTGKSVEHIRPPLASELFSDREVFNVVIDQFAKVQGIVPFLRHLKGKNIEAVLRDIQVEAEHSHRRRQELMAVRYYLQYVISACGESWNSEAKGVTNYKTLLNEVDLCRHDEEVCLVTFNYDTLLEKALPGVDVKIVTMEDYVRGDSPYKLIKPHGSVDWGHPVRAVYSDPSAWSIAKQNIDRASEPDELRIATEFVKTQGFPCGLINGNIGTIPAIAIPVERKSTFECPEYHFSVLERCLSSTDRLLLIGWRGTEDHFISMLRQHIRGRVFGQIVTGTEMESQNLAMKLDQELPGANVSWDFPLGGFTDFIIDRRIRSILT